MVAYIFNPVLRSQRQGFICENPAWPTLFQDSQSYKVWVLSRFVQHFRGNADNFSLTDPSIDALISYKLKIFVKVTEIRNCRNFYKGLRLLKFEILERSPRHV